MLIAAKLLHRRKLAANAAKQSEDEIRSLLDSISESVLCQVIDSSVLDISKKWIKYVRVGVIIKWVRTLLQIQFICRKLYVILVAMKYLGNAELAGELGISQQKKF